MRINTKAIVRYTMLCILMLTGILYSSPEHIIDDYKFTNQNWTLKEVYSFFDQFPKCKLNREKQKYIDTYCREYKLNFFAVAAQIEKEASLIRNSTSFDYKLRERRALGYACYIIRKDKNGKEYRPYEGYNIQIKEGIRCMRKHFDNYYKGVKKKVLSKEKYIVPVNAASYSLYMYTPFYGEAIAFGHHTVGNRRYESCYKYLLPKWERVKLKNEK